MRSGKEAKRGGFAYVLLLVVMAIVALVATAAISTGAALARRSAEEQLLGIGSEIENALTSYRTAGCGQSIGPKSLQDLLKDPRFPVIRRHLRRIYADPITGKAEWGILKAQDGSIVAVYSLAPGIPLKRVNFSPDQSHFENALKYSNWIFSASHCTQVCHPL